MDITFSPEQSCYTIATAAQECMAVGICVDWRKFAAECPFDCADEKIYMPCQDTCDTTAKTCDDLFGKDERPSAGACQYRETCGCPQGTLEFNQTCIEATHCPICNGTYKEGEKWENPDDPCEVNECKNGEIQKATIQCEYEKSECSELGMRKVIVSSNETCCQQSQCVCLPALCPEKPLCGEHEDLNILPGHESKCCPEYYCRAKECDVQVYQDFLQVEDCISKIKVNMTLCDGFCSSRTILEEYFEKTEKNKQCTCCTAVEMDSFDVDFRCPGGIEVTHRHDIITKCQCNASECLP